MSKIAKITILSVSLALVLFSIIGGLGVKASTGDGAYRHIEVYSEVLSRIRSEYVEEPNMTAVTDGALHGLLESLDANSSYLTAAEYKEFKANKNQGKAGIGATVSKRFGYAAVVSVLPGGPADKANLEDGDILESIAGKSSRDMSLAEIQSVLDGQPGSSIEVSVVRARRAEPVKATIVRAITPIPPAAEKNLEDGIGDITVEALTKGKSQDIANQIKAAQKAGDKKLILDLRDVSEGDEDEGVATANLFLDHGTIAYLQGQKYPRQNFNADAAKAITKLPLVVLVNHGTGGAAEIVAAAIMENARGDVIGDKTFGIGSVQKTIEMEDGSALILSVAKYYSPSGKSIQDVGITPNVLVADNEDDYVAPEDEGSSSKEPLKKDKKAGPDEQLHRAIDVLKTGDKGPAASQSAAGATPASAPQMGNPLVKKQ
jgi:carboxyl-terminal processing protease